MLPYMLFQINNTRTGAVGSEDFWVLNSSTGQPNGSGKDQTQRFPGPSGSRAGSAVQHVGSMELGRAAPLRRGAQGWLLRCWEARCCQDHRAFQGHFPFPGFWQGSSPLTSLVSEVDWNAGHSHMALCSRGTVSGGWPQHFSYLFQVTWASLCRRCDFWLQAAAISALRTFSGSEVLQWLSLGCSHSSPKQARCHRQRSGEEDQLCQVELCLLKAGPWPRRPPALSGCSCSAGTQHRAEKRQRNSDFETLPRRI